MHIILDDYGVELSKADHMFSIKLGEQERSISPAKVTAIHIYKHTRLSSAALLLAAENDIPVLLYDGHYKPAVRIWHSNFSSSGQVRVMQPVFCKSSAGLWWCRHIICLKIEGQLHNLTHFAHRFTAARQSISQCMAGIQNIQEAAKQLNCETGSRNTLRGYEGSSAAAYWQAVSGIMEEIVFTRRVQQHAAEPFNVCLNYLYGILYGKIEGALLCYGLDPMVGLMHAEGYSKKSLVYDCIEPFRHWAELLLVNLFKSKGITSAHFAYTEQKMTLEKSGRKLLAAAFLHFLSEKTVMNNRRITRNDQLTAFASALAQAVKNHKA